MRIEAAQTEIEKRLQRCCFTGHRPEKLSCSDEDVIAWLKAEILSTIDDGFVTFISGMAHGVDIRAAEIVLRLRDEGKPIHLICARPFEGFERNWSDDWKGQYNDVLQRADIVKFVCKGYNSACFQIRNEWMVDHSAMVIAIEAIVIAVFNGQPGGTKNTVDYALRQNVEVIQ